MQIYKIIILLLIQLNYSGLVSSSVTSNYRHIGYAVDFLSMIAEPFKQRFSGDINQKLNELQESCDGIYETMRFHGINLKNQMTITEEIIEKISDDTIRSHFSNILRTDSKIVLDNIEALEEFRQTHSYNSNNKRWRSFKFESLDWKKTKLLELEDAHFLEYMKFYLAETEVCGDSFSLQQVTYEVYGMLMTTELSRFFVTLFGKKLQNIFSNAQTDKDIEFVLAQAKVRLNNIADNFERGIKKIPKYIRHCDPKSQEEVKRNVGTMGDLFQVMFFREIDDAIYKCPGNCKRIDSHTNFMNLDCERKNGEANYCPQRIPCVGRIYKCEPMNEVRVCHGDTSRYKWFEDAKSHKKYGPDDTCADYNLFQYHGATSVSGCGLCRCVCVNSNPMPKIEPAGTIYNPPQDTSIFKISLKWKRSLTRINRVITGVSLKVGCSMLYLEIQESKVGRNWELEGGVIDWNIPCFEPEPLVKRFFEKEDPNSEKDSKIIDDDKDFIIITEYEYNTINLDNLIVPHGRVITGVRFALSKKPEKPRRIELQVESMEYDYEVGILKPMTEGQLSSSEDNKVEIKLNVEDYDIPTRVLEESNIVSRNGSYLRFTLSSMEKDAGQSVVPFIEQKVFANEPRSLVAGVGLYHKRSSANAGYLAIRLFSIDFGKIISQGNSEGNLLVPNTKISHDFHQSNI